MAKATLTSKRAELRFERIREALKQKPMTVAQLALSIHICKRWALPYIKKLHENGEIYIREWKSNVKGGNHAATYAFGSRPDAKKPESKDFSTRAREYRARVNADPERRIVYLAKKKARAWKLRRDVAAAWVPSR